MNTAEKWHGTTIVLLRKNNETVVAGDGQVSLGNTVLKSKAKKAVAVALRNRWRRQALSDEMRDEVLPKNILMIGPTGVGKTEISRRLSKLAEAPFIKVEKLGEMDTELFREWFQAFSQSAGITLHVENIYGENSHHKIESCFKGLARSLKEALTIDKRIKNSIPSTKGKL